MELGDRESEGIAHNLGMSYTSLKQYDKAIELLEQSLDVKKEFGDKVGQAVLALGRLSRHGQHDMAGACLKHAWPLSTLGDEMHQVRAASTGEALWARARAEHHQAAPHHQLRRCLGGRR